MQIAIMATAGSMMSAISGLADMFWITNQLLPASIEASRFRIAIVSPDGKPVADAQGRTIAVDDAFASITAPDVILACGMALGSNKLPALTSPEAVAWLRQQHQRGAKIGGACAGGYLLGDAGLLDGRECATTWWLYPTFRARYPRAKMVWGKALIEERNVITTGGPLSWVDLALHIIRQHAGDEVARMAADMTVADSQPISQQIYAPRGFLNTIDPLLLRAEQLIRYENPAITVEALASALNLSPRTLHRKLADLTHESPKHFITRVRIESACLLLENPSANIRHVAAACGYTEDTAFRKAFSQLINMTPAQYKHWAAARNTKHGH
ncbi:helix-turn-helix domain-containing protein [Kosakonia sp. SOY2]|uniref:GlxA family transcriptional regulator n=1 Tax=Kosakonia sp. SOY2 TaxID=3014557 RepID=UPI0022AC39F2|nr:helix-turn-helix domain-containing protein [Kosakonia sp. SOY2]MCZ3382826.1 helix-turn-helix domain-containing protein [Kosakonia sp. SOY2]